MSTYKNIVSLAQICSTKNIDKNLLICKQLIHLAKSKNSTCIFFPEATDFITDSVKSSLDLVDSSAHFIKSIQREAFLSRINVGIGIHQKAENNKLFNSYLFIDDKGSITCEYKKVHLFDVNIKEGPKMLESSIIERGNKIFDPVETSFGKLGICICYDIRFPQMSQILRRKEAQIIIYPSAFTVKTGTAHWETLLRARAIETQCYVLAPAQIGKHNDKRESYGHTMGVDPFGKILNKLTIENNQILNIEIDLDYLQEVRKQMPVAHHQRNDLYH